MPLTKTGQEVMNNMKKTYKNKGGPKKAKEVFYASINKKKPGSQKWHR